MKVTSFKEWLVQRKYPDAIVNPNEGFGDDFSRAQQSYDNQTPYDDEADCRTCGGEGHVECELCDGTDESCEGCSGTGSVKCQECEGSGVVTKSSFRNRRDDDEHY